LPGPERVGRPERADAARNRTRILASAAELFDKHGAESVSLDAIAAHAAVGKGTLYRRFGDKAGLAAALLDAKDRDLESRIISGPPPLGPGASAADRIVAFADAYLDLLDAALDLVRLSETSGSGARYRVGSYRFWHEHLTILLRAARPELDADVTAHLLLASLAAELHQLFREQRLAGGRAHDAVLAVFRSVAGV
jgi:AcrR family transcriptional regulator